MLKDQREIEIMAEARQDALRNPGGYNVQCFKNLIGDFVDIVPGGEYLDIGAGQWDFADTVKNSGGVCEGVDFDPCVIELGRYRGYRAYNVNYNREALNLDKQFNGVFSRSSINPISYSYNFDFLRGFINEVDDAIKPGGWGLIIPWYSTLDDMIETKNEYKELDDAFKLKGYQNIRLTREEVLRYGGLITGTRYVYIKTNK